MLRKDILSGLGVRVRLSQNRSNFLLMINSEVLFWKNSYLQLYANPVPMLVRKNKINQSKWSFINDSKVGSAKRIAWSKQTGTTAVCFFFFVILLYLGYQGEDLAASVSS